MEIEDPVVKLANTIQNELLEFWIYAKDKKGCTVLLQTEEGFKLRLFVKRPKGHAEVYIEQLFCFYEFDKMSSFYHKMQVGKTIKHMVKKLKESYGN